MHSRACVRHKNDNKIQVQFLSPYTGRETIKLCERIFALHNCTDINEWTGN